VIVLARAHAVAPQSCTVGLAVETFVQNKGHWLHIEWGSAPRSCWRPFKLHRRRPHRGHCRNDQPRLRCEPEPGAGLQCPGGATAARSSRAWSMPCASSWPAEHAIRRRSVLCDPRSCRDGPYRPRSRRSATYHPVTCSRRSAKR
jgi:hypothetical protein